MTSKKERLQNFKLYAITDLQEDNPVILDQIEAAYQGGADIVQLRSKSFSDAALYRLACQVKRMAQKYRKLFFVNDRVDLALAVQADGVHLGQDDLPVEAARELAKKAGQDLLIGLSTHSVAQAREAERRKADYFAVGPVLATPTKPGRKAVGLELVREVSEFAKTPFLAIGGIDATNARAVLEAGASRLGVVRAIFNAPDVYQAAKQLKELIEEVKPTHV